MPLTVMLHSACVNLDRQYDLDVYIISDGVPTAHRNRLESALQQHGSTIQVTWIDSDAERLAALPTTEHFTLAMYFRLMAPRILPPKYEKAIYLDADMIVEGDLSELFMHDISEWHLGAIPSFRPRTLRESPLGAIAIDGSPDAKYFNSGVLLINLTQWRSDCVQDQAIHFCHEHKDQIRFPDQDGLNAVLVDKWTALDPAWNFTMPSAPIYFGSEITEVAGMIQNSEIRILHYTTKFKPWNTLGRAPGHDRFYHYLRDSDWFTSSAAYYGWTLKRQSRAVLHAMKRRLTQ